jgi:hypothetical protein
VRSTWIEESGGALAHCPIRRTASMPGAQYWGRAVLRARGLCAKLNRDSRLRMPVGVRRSLRLAFAAYGKRQRLETLRRPGAGGTRQAGRAAGSRPPVIVEATRAKPLHTPRAAIGLPGASAPSPAVQGGERDRASVLRRSATTRRSLPHRLPPTLHSGQVQRYACGLPPLWTRRRRGTYDPNPQTRQRPPPPDGRG